jgi:hypothetical protein
MDGLSGPGVAAATRHIKERMQKEMDGQQRRCPRCRLLNNRSLRFGLRLDAPHSPLFALQETSRGRNTPCVCMHAYRLHDRKCTLGPVTTHAHRWFDTGNEAAVFPTNIQRPSERAGDEKRTH